MAEYDNKSMPAGVLHFKPTNKRIPIWEYDVQKQTLNRLQGDREVWAGAMIDPSNRQELFMGYYVKTKKYNPLELLAILTEGSKNYAIINKTLPPEKQMVVENQKYQFKQ